MEINSVLLLRVSSVVDKNVNHPQFHNSLDGPGAGGRIRL
jgi:hypothetical protein